MNKNALILLAHGSKNPQWLAPFQRLTADIQKDAGEGTVFLAFMGDASPTLEEAIRQAAQSGATHLRVLPLFMATGNHLRLDLPAMVKEVQEKIPGLEISLMPPIGEHPQFALLLRQLVLEQVG